MFICFLSLFVSIQVSDACVTILSIIVVAMLTMCLIIIVSTKSKPYTHKQYEMNTKGRYVALILHTEYSKLLRLK